jgi:hypothetical protein
MLLTDLCNRLTARALVNRSTSGRVACDHADRLPPIPTETEAAMTNVGGGARPSFDDLTPAGPTLDGVRLQLWPIR